MLAILITNLIIFVSILLLGLLLLLSRNKQQQLLLQITTSQQAYLDQINRLTDINKNDNTQLHEAVYRLNNDLRDRFDHFRSQLQDQHLKSLDVLATHLKQGVDSLRQQINEMTTQQSQKVTTELNKLTTATQEKLREISGQVDKRLTEGFEKTTATFTDIMQRLAVIDEAQKRITELSSNVVSLQEILSDKRSRGAFGEVQLSALIRNVIPEQHFAFQYTLKNSCRADCILFLPDPTGNIVIDAKFPLEQFRKLINPQLTEFDKKAISQQFKIDIKKHIHDIASKYIIPGETADGAVMFIPAEAIFAEIHANYPELVELAHNNRVWLVSPTTMMAILTTARAVIKDDATRKQVHIIQEHLRRLAKNFDLFKARMDKLSQHIKQAHNDVDLIHTSAHKITSQFEKIEQVELVEDKKTLPEEIED